MSGWLVAEVCSLAETEMKRTMDVSPWENNTEAHSPENKHFCNPWANKITPGIWCLVLGATF